MSWDRGAVLHCDTKNCLGKVDVMDQNRAVTLAYARAHGWRCYDGRSLTGKEIVSHICPTCGGTPRSKLPESPPKLDQDVPLF